MSSFKKNRFVPKITEKGNDIVNQAEGAVLIASTNKHVKEITIPFTQEMADLLEMIFIHFEGDISRRKLCSKYLLKSLKLEAAKLGLTDLN